MKLPELQHKVYSLLVMVANVVNHQSFLINKYCVPTSNDVMAAEVVRIHNEHECMINSFLEKLYTYFAERPRTEVTLEAKYYVLEFGLINYIIYVVYHFS